MSTLLKVGVLIDSEMVRGFEYEILKDLSTLDTCDVSIFMYTLDKKFVQNPLLESYLKIDAKINARGKNQILRKSIKDLDIVVNSELNQKFDLLLNLTDNKVSAKIATLSKYDVWELRFGERQFNADMAGVLEVFESSDTTTITLIAKDYLIDKFVLATDVLSPTKNRNSSLLRASVFVVQNIKKLSLGKDDFIKEKVEKLHFVKDKECVSTSLTNVLIPVLKLGVRNITSRVDKLFRKQQWSIYFAVNGDDSSFNQNMSEYKMIDTPKEFFWADPFVVDKDDKSYIFFEEYVYKTHKGHLSVIEYDHKSEEFSKAREILNTPYHLSYPFMMEFEGEYYMIPEGSADRDIKLYKATNFPHEWEVVHTLMSDVVAVDTTLFYKDETWWMFTNIIEKDGLSLNEELYIYHCKDFLKDTWVAHVQNPVVSSLQTSRPAGNIIEHNGSFYRPSQNSVGWYGKSTNFNKILTLTPTVYKEEFVSEITPEMVNGIYAVHTYNSSQKITVIDGLRKIGRFF